MPDFFSLSAVRDFFLLLMDVEPKEKEKEKFLSIVFRMTAFDGIWDTVSSWKKKDKKYPLSLTRQKRKEKEKIIIPCALCVKLRYMAG